jgi:hypothetical protein
LLEQPCNKSDNGQTCYKVVLTSLIQYCYIMTVSDLLEQLWNKADNMNKLFYKLFMTCNKIDGIITLATRLF